MKVGLKNEWLKTFEEHKVALKDLRQTMEEIVDGTETIANEAFLRGAEIVRSFKNDQQALNSNLIVMSRIAKWRALWIALVAAET